MAISSRSDKFISPAVANPERSVPLGTHDNRRMGTLKAAALLLPIFLTAVIAGFYLYQAKNQEDYRFYNFPWHAHWISCPTPVKTACFRKQFYVTGTVQSAYMAIAADNFFDVQINEMSTFANYHSSLTNTLIRSHTLYTALGYKRFAPRARIFEIGRFLKPGSNVVTILVQSDSGQPKLAVQGSIIATKKTDFVSDANWKAAPFYDDVARVPWVSTKFIDDGWSNAATTKEQVNIPVDGMTDILEKPLDGDFIAYNAPAGVSDVRFTKKVNLPGITGDGWLRIAAVNSYDIFLNKRLIASNSMVNRYRHTLLGNRNVYDALFRTQGYGFKYPVTNGSLMRDMYLLKNLFKVGDNELEVVLHKTQTLGPSSPFAFSLDSSLNYDKHQLEIHSDSSWLAQPVQLGLAPQLAAVISEPGLKNNALTQMRLRGRIDPGLETYRTTVIFDVCLFVILIIVSYLFVNLLRRLNIYKYRSNLEGMGALCIPTAVIMVCAWLLQTVFNGSPQSSFLIGSKFSAHVLELAGFCYVAIPFAPLLSRKKWQQGTWNPDMRTQLVYRFDQLYAVATARSHSGFLQKYVFGIALGIVSLVSTVYYFHGISKLGYIPDEYISILAAKGILHHGVPVYEIPNVIYTRSALYHYLLALVMFIGGESTSPVYMRFLSVFWQVGTIILIYFFGKDVKSRSAGLAAAALVGLSPFLIYYAREARFYTQLSFFTTLVFYLLWRSFRFPDKIKYKLGVCIAYACAYLSHQLAIAAVPAILIAIMVSGQTKAWFNKKCIIGILFALLVMIADFYAYLHWCVTPLPYIDQETVTLFGLHIDYLELMPSMVLLNVERSQMPSGLLYISGLAYAFIRLFRRGSKSQDVKTEGWTWWGYLYLMSVVTIFFSTLLTPRPANRYGIQCTPIVLLTAACAADYIGRKVAEFIRINTGRDIVALYMQRICAVGIIFICLAAYRPVRTWHTEDREINVDHTAVAKFLKDHMQPGDKLMFNSPQTALVEVGKCDYMWRYPASIFYYIGRDGKLRNRDTGAIGVDNVDKLRHIISENRRLWVVMPIWQLIPTGKHWAISQFVLQNFREVNQSFGLKIMLWDRDRNYYKNPMRNMGYDKFNF